MLKAAIVILNWNTRKHLERFVPAVIQHSDVEGVKIFVADNGSEDDSVQFLEENYPDKVGIIRLEKNYGYAEGYNRALHDLQSEYFILLNSDVEPSSNWLSPLFELMESDTMIAACMPKILSSEQREFFEYAGAAGGFIDKYGFPFCQGRMFNSLETDYGQYDKVKEIFWASGACMMVRGPLYKICGGLDQDFFAHMEEIDLCWRLKNRGYKIMFQPASTVYHLGGGTLPQDNPRKLFLNYRNNLYLLYKNLPEKKRCKIFLARLFLDKAATLRFFVSGKFGMGIAVIKAYYTFIMNFGKYKNFRKNEKRFITDPSHDEIYPGSIAIEFFLRKKYTFKSLRWLIHGG